MKNDWQLKINNNARILKKFLKYLEDKLIKSLKKKHSHYYKNARLG